METGIILAALVIVGLCVTFTLGALWAVRATLERDRTLAQGAATALQEEIARVASNHASLIGGLKSTAQGLTATIEVLRRDLNAVQEDARAAKLEAHKPAPIEETAFLERPAPANDGATATAGRITLTKLSPALAPRDPKA